MRSHLLYHPIDRGDLPADHKLIRLILYGKDLLAVMARYVAESAGGNERAMAVEAYSKAKDVYRRRGNMNGYAMMKMSWLDVRHELPKTQGGISAKAYGDSLRALLDEVKMEEAGADVALKYYGCMEERKRYDDDDDKLVDEEIGFLKWTLANVARSKSTAALEQALQRLTRPRVDAGFCRDYAAGRPVGVSVEMWNTDKVELTVRRYAGVKKQKNGEEEILLTGDVVLKKTVTLAPDSAGEARKLAGLPLKGVVETDVTVPVGRFVLVAEACGEKQVELFHVSSMRLTSPFTPSQAGGSGKLSVLSQLLKPLLIC